MKDCIGTLGELKSLVIVDRRWNYPDKLAKAMKNNDLKYINLMLKRGRLHFIDQK